MKIELLNVRIYLSKNTVTVDSMKSLCTMTEWQRKQTHYK